MKVLIADGSPLIHARIRSLFADLPEVAITGCAVDVERAESMAAAHPPDVLIIDASLPRGGCRRLLRTLGAGADAGGPVAIVLASPASTPYRQRLKEAGAAFVFDKVYEMDRFVDAVTSLGRVASPAGSPMTSMPR